MTVTGDRQEPKIPDFAGASRILTLGLVFSLWLSENGAPQKSTNYILAIFVFAALAVYISPEIGKLYEYIKGGSEDVE